MNDEADAYCSAQVRTGDPDRFFSSLFARGPSRSGLIALCALNFELQHIRAATREGALAQIRLQWWRESVERLYGGRTDDHPVCVALSRAVAQSRLPRDGLLTLIDAYDDEFSSEPGDDLIPAARTKATAMFALAARILVPAAPDVLDEVVAPAGEAFAHAHVLRAAAREAAQSSHGHRDLARAAHGVAATAHHHLVRARTAFARAGRPEALPAFLPLALVPLYVKVGGAEIALHRRLVRLLWAGARGRF